MKAMCIDENKNFVWADVPEPIRKDGEVVVRIRATALNRADVMQRAGTYSPPEGWPEWAGLECAGEICEVGADSRFQIGDKVCALLGGGGYAEKVVVPEGMVMPMPKGLSFEEAAAIPEVFATAFLNFRYEGNLQKGETVLIHAAASGLGLAAIQVAKKVFGAKVIASVGSDEKCSVVREFGADIATNRKTENLVELLSKNPPDVALDPVGGNLMGGAFAQMNRYGRWISIASLAGAETLVDINTVWRKGLKLIGSTLRSRTSEFKAKLLAEMVDEMWEMFETKKIIPVIHKILPISEVDEAHRILEANENMGKVVLTIQ